MKSRGVLFSFLVVLALLFFSSIAGTEETAYQEKKSFIENLVNEAANLIETKGQEGLDIIREKNGRFNNNDVYVFVTSGTTGADLFNPAFQEIEGLSPENYTDPDAKAAQMIIVNAVKDKDTAWVEYLWPKPQETKHSKKISYLKKIIINGKIRIVGAGFYPE